MIKFLALWLFCLSSCFSEEISDFQARLEFARILSYEKHYDESLVEYRKLLKEDPHSLPIQIEIGKVLYYKGDHAEALQILESVPEQDLDEKNIMLIGDLAAALKDYPKAERILNKHLEAHPADNEVKFKLAELYAWQKKYEQSIAIYESLLKTFPDDIQLRRKYAMVLLWMGNESKAAIELKKTLKD